MTLFFTRPISAILGGLIISVWFFPILATFLEKAKKRNQISVQ